MRVDRLDAGVWQATLGDGIFVGNAGLHLALPWSARGVAVHRRTEFWLAPRFWNDAAEIPAATLLLIWHLAEGAWGAMIPLIGRDARVELQGHDAGLFARVETHHPDGLEPGVPLAVAAEGSDPYDLVDRLMDHAVRLLGRARRRDEKPVPAWAHRLGWCSWNAFYERVTEDDVLAAARSFADGPVSLGFMILDDGWLDADGDRRLRSFAPNEKFPRGLAPLIAECKELLGLEAFGVWHAFLGYWWGVAPTSQLAEDFRVLDSGLVHLDVFAEFVDAFHARLADAGVDFVKVDNQGATIHFLRNQRAYVSGMWHLRQALEGSVSRHFGGGLINCMSQETAALYQLRESTLIRNSDDFYPDREGNPGEHVLQNAFNALWTRTIGVPDWDMFQSHHHAAWWHAAARAVSGGPVYVTDDPGHQDWDVLQALVMPDGLVPPLREHAVPTRQSLVTDPRTEGVLSVFNHADHGALVAVFNLRDGPAEWRVGAVDAEMPASAERYVVWSRHQGVLGEGAREDRFRHVVPAGAWDVLVVAPVANDAAVIGAPDALNPVGWVEARRDRGRTLEISLRAAGSLGVVTRSAPREVRCDGRSVSFSWADGVATAACDRAPGTVIWHVDL